MKKIIRKTIGSIAMFIGLAAGCAVDSDIPLWGTLLLIAMFIAGVFGGGYLFCKGEPIPDIE